MMKPYVCLIYYIFIFLFPIQENHSQEHDFLSEFKWTILHKDKNNRIMSVQPGKQENLNITQKNNEISATKYDQFKIYLQPGKNAYIYIYLYRSNKELIILFPQNIKRFENNIYFSNNFYLPAENSWLSFKRQKDTAKIYFIASTKRLTKLETLNQRLLELIGKSTETKIQTGRLKQQILHEIILLKRKNIEMEEYTELPIQIAGSIRGEEKKIQFTASCMQIKNLFIKTILFKYKY